ncbi:family 43 glycosylhydrolase [bacterium]|nr:family 43 glycosylhydrolase [bacterium]
MKRLLPRAALCLLAASCLAQNPISPPGVYIADPAARVWPDGRLYVYGSLDESLDHYCSHRHHLLSTSDLVTWTLHEDIFSSRGGDDQVEYNDELLFAPDCQYADGTYFLYYCQPGLQAEGVAGSPNPDGPFRDGKRIELYGRNQIDPAVFIDDDGQAYYLWGQFTCKMARLKPNMTEIDRGSIRDSILTEEEHHFHEGVSMIKRNGLYYLVYAHMGRADMPTCIGYAMSRNPMGPYTYGGVIIDNDHCDPGNWNNHGSIVRFDGQWYVFYHRATHGSNVMRKACMEPIAFNPDGTIDEVEMTSRGAGGPLDAFSGIDAARACLLSGHVRITLDTPGNEILSGIEHRDRAAFKYLDFGEGADSVYVRVRPGGGAGRMQFVADRAWGVAAGEITVPALPEAPAGWVTLGTAVSGLEGVRALWLRFYGDGGELFEVDSFTFK